MSDYFSQCQIETSDFDRKFAESSFDWELLKSTWENPSTGKMPELLHFIWLGGKIPKIYDDNVWDWAERTSIPVRLWTDENVKDMEMVNRDLFDRSTNMGGKSDILRLEILRQFGGLYIDVDYVLVNSYKLMTDVFDGCEFFGCALFDKEVAVNNGFMGAVPNHPIINLAIKNCRLDNPWGVACPQTLLQYQTGPKLLTCCIMNYLYRNKDHNVKIAPTTVCHSYPPALRNEITDELLNKYVKPESIAVHLWNSSYSPNSKFYAGN